MKKIENSFSVSGFVANNAEIRNFTTSGKFTHICPLPSTLK